MVGIGDRNLGSERTIVVRLWELEYESEDESG